MGNFAFRAKEVWSIAGLAFLWPCLQSSGFYPLSLTASVGSVDPALVARFHLFYSIVLIALFVVLIALRKRAEALLHSKSSIPVLAGGMGITGHLLLVMGDVSQPSSMFSLIVGSVGIAVFIAVFVVLWGCRFSCGNEKHAVFAVALSYLGSQLGLVAYCATGLPYVPLICLCVVCTMICSIVSTRNVPSECSFGLSSLRQVPWRMVAFSVLLIYFCTIYIRLQITEFTGDAPVSNKLFAAILCVCVFSVVVLYLAKKSDSESSFVVIFIILVSVCMVGLSAIALFSGDGNVLARRILIAGEHCVEVFVWMTFTYIVVRKRLSAVLVFGLFGIVVVALPWVLSFDLRYLTAIVGVMLPSDLLNSIVIVALCATALGAIAFMASYTLQISRESAQHTSNSQQKVAQKALEGLDLTEREFEVAGLVYRGYSAKKISELLYISEPTVKAYTSKVYRKLGIHSKQELIGYIDERTPLF